MEQFPTSFPVICTPGELRSLISFLTQTGPPSQAKSTWRQSLGPKDTYSINVSDRYTYYQCKPASRRYLIWYWRPASASEAFKVGGKDTMWQRETSFSDSLRRDNCTLSFSVESSWHSGCAHKCFEKCRVNADLPYHVKGRGSASHCA